MHISVCKTCAMQCLHIIPVYIGMHACMHRVQTEIFLQAFEIINVIWEFQWTLSSHIIMQCSELMFPSALQSLLYEMLRNSPICHQPNNSRLHIDAEDNCSEENDVSQKIDIHPRNGRPTLKLGAIWLCEFFDPKNCCLYIYISIYYIYLYIHISLYLHLPN
jgi:hypothetical protein